MKACLAVRDGHGKKAQEFEGQNRVRLMAAATLPRLVQPAASPTLHIAAAASLEGVLRELLALGVLVLCLPRFAIDAGVICIQHFFLDSRQANVRPNSGCRGQRRLRRAAAKVDRQRRQLLPASALFKLLGDADIPVLGFDHHHLAAPDPGTRHKATSHGWVMLHLHENRITGEWPQLILNDVRHDDFLLLVTIQHTNVCKTRAKHRFRRRNDITYCRN
jgi:hypothetical protein